MKRRKNKIRQRSHSTPSQEIPVEREHLVLVERALELGVTIYPSEVPVLIADAQRRDSLASRVRSRL